MSDLQATPAKQKSDRRPYILLVIVAVLLVYLLAFALLNTQQVHVSFVAFATDTALIWVMIACAALGLIVGALGTFLLLHRRHR